MSQSYRPHKSIMVDEPPPKSGEGWTARDLLQDYLDRAISKQKYQHRLSKVMEYGLNFIIILQVIVTALVTVTTSLDQTPRIRIASVVLGALATVTAALIARAKGTNQPELAQNHAKDLEKFIGRCKMFITESGPSASDDVKQGVMDLVGQYEAIEDKALQTGRGRETQAINSAASMAQSSGRPAVMQEQHSTGPQLGTQPRQ